MLARAAVKARPREDDLVRCALTGRRSVRDAHARRRREVVACSRDAILHATVDRSVELEGVARIGDLLDQRRTRPGRPTVERLHHEVASVRREEDLGVLELFVEDVYDAVAIGTDRASGLTPLARRHIVRRAHLLVHPRVAAIGRGRDDRRRGTRALELVVADVDVAEERTALGVVDPELLLVAERGGGLLRQDHGRLPRALDVRRRRRDVVRPGHGDALEPLQPAPGRQSGNEVRVVQPGAVRPREVAVCIGRRSERQGWILKGSETPITFTEQPNHRSWHPKEQPPGTGRSTLRRTSASLRRPPGSRGNEPVAGRDHRR